MKKHLWVGITGGIGAGKSAVARIFAEAGYPVLSADEINRELTQAGGAALGEIQAIFGARAIAADGSLDRGFLRAEITRDPSLRLRLEALMHPRIQKLSREKAEALFASGASLVFYEAPLLFEAGGGSAMDTVITVHAPDSVRVERTMKRDKCSRELAEKLLASQMPQEEKMKRADFLIENSGDEKALRAAALEVLSKLTQA